MVGQCNYRIREFIVREISENCFAFYKPCKVLKTEITVKRKCIQK